MEKKVTGYQMKWNLKVSFSWLQVLWYTRGKKNHYYWATNTSIVIQYDPWIFEIFSSITDFFVLQRDDSLIIYPFDFFLGQRKSWDKQKNIKDIILVVLKKKKQVIISYLDSLRIKTVYVFSQYDPYFLKTHL